MILRAMVDKVRKMFGQTPVVELQPQAVALEHDPVWYEQPIKQPGKIKLYNVYLHQRKNKSQRRNWKKYKGQRATK